MNDITNSAERLHGSLHMPVLVIIEQFALPRTCILATLRRELPEYDILDMATTQGLDCTSARDVRLVLLSIGGKLIDDPSVDDDLALVAECCPNASIAILSNHDDEATALAAMRRGVRGFIPNSLLIEVAVAGLRLVLAGGVYRPLPIIGLNRTPGLEQPYPRGLASAYLTQDFARGAAERHMTDFTPREHQVLAELELGLPNKLIAAKLNLSENTVKMHVQHIMRKCAARNRTEAVLRSSGRLSLIAIPTRTPPSIPET
ncbi:LuxR family transcriptional regulator [Bradyrhizobium sp. NAS80.1]|uniref:response regulator transcription factor n=1 Tax=Bradyrhizobium sp. NAS80.1 TaxID=1680159 RepID=UPI000969F9A8|nr:response regulator transcription factor [Bradyrhizobium sp. NAS80.1]OKO76063.1 LuxR family transcriptional regulator [Bradyrhizobium sp. NAS80.1]